MRTIPAAAAVALAVTLAATAATADGAHSHGVAARACSSTLAMQTLADRDSKLVRLTPTQSTVGELGALAAPKAPPKRRSTAFQRRTWRVVAQITSFRAGPNGDIQLELFDHNAYMLASIPARTCDASRPAAAHAISVVRSQFLATCGRPHAGDESLGAIGYVNGVGFWGRPGSGTAKNGASLNPVTGITLVAGCGA